VNENWMTIKECAEKARVSVCTIHSWMKAGFRGKKLRAERAGWAWRVNPTDFLNFLRWTAESTETEAEVVGEHIHLPANWSYR